jgi:hypothetical protein
LIAAEHDQLPMVIWLLREGGATLTEADNLGRTCLLRACLYNHQPIVKWLLEEGGASIKQSTNLGNTALLLAIESGHHAMATWLLEHGGSSVMEETNDRCSVWQLMRGNMEFVESDTDLDTDPNTRIGRSDEDLMALTTLLRVMLLRSAPPPMLVAEVSLVHKQLMREGIRLRQRLPFYLARRRALVEEHCPLLEPLRALVLGYQEPTTTEELWATGLQDTPVKNEMSATQTFGVRYTYDKHLRSEDMLIPTHIPKKAKKWHFPLLPSPLWP